MTPEAALAAALHATDDVIGLCNPWATPEGHAHIHEHQAAAILAALPPDWCGHVLEIIDLQHKWADANGDAMREADEYEAKIAKLRAAGDALAAAVGAMRDAVDPDDASEGTFWLAVDAAIAALAKWKEVTDG